MVRILCCFSRMVRMVCCFCGQRGSSIGSAGCGCCSFPPFALRAGRLTPVCLSGGCPVHTCLLVRWMSCTHLSTCPVDVLYTLVCLSGECPAHSCLLVRWMSCTHLSACPVDVLHTHVCLSGGCLVHTCESCELASGF